MKKVLIIEDDYFNAQRLGKLLLDMDGTLELHGPLKSVAEVIDELSSDNTYDLIFSDIQLIDGNVFDAFRGVEPQSFVIFITAYDEYAMQAIKNNGLDYLLKPVDFESLCNAVGKLNLIKPDCKNDALAHMDKLLEEARTYRERFLVNRGDELILLNIDDVSFFRIQDNHVSACQKDGTSYPLALSLNDLEGELDPNKFFRLNRQYIANITGIRKISLFFGSKLIIKLKGCSDNNIMISKEKAALLKNWLNR